MIAGEVDKNHVYTEKDFNKRIVIMAREAARVRVFMDEMNPYDKTIVFCNDQEHALLIRDLINKYKKVADPNYCADHDLKEPSSFEVRGGLALPNHTECSAMVVVVQCWQSHRASRMCLGRFTNVENTGSGSQEIPR